MTPPLARGVLPKRIGDTEMRVFRSIAFGWLLLWPATAAATVTLEALPEPVIADLRATEVGERGGPVSFDSAETRLEAATIGLHIDEEHLVLARIEQAALWTGPNEGLLVAGIELAYRRTFLSGSHVRPFASAGIGWIGSTLQPFTLETISPELEPQLRLVLGVDVRIRDGWSAEAYLPVRYLTESERAFATATLGIRRTF